MEWGQFPVITWLCSFGGKSMQRTHMQTGSILIIPVYTWPASLFCTLSPLGNLWHDIWQLADCFVAFCCGLQSISVGQFDFACTSITCFELHRWKDLRKCIISIFLYEAYNFDFPYELLWVINVYIRLGDVFSVVHANWQGSSGTGVRRTTGQDTGNGQCRRSHCFLFISSHCLPGPENW